MSEQEKIVVSETVKKLTELPSEAQNLAVAFSQGLIAGQKIAEQKEEK